MCSKKGKVCCFTGHRDIPNDKALQISENLKKIIIEKIQEGYDCFLAGGAMGFDMLAELTILELKFEYPNIKLKLVLPYPEHHKSWARKMREIYEYILKNADEIEYVCNQYYMGCFHLRNNTLVDYSDCCICYLEKESGGTAYTVEKAKMKNIPIYNL